MYNGDYVMAFDENGSPYLSHMFERSKHKYLRKIGDRYFYTQQELNAFFNRLRGNYYAAKANRAKRKSIAAQRENEHMQKQVARGRLSESKLLSQKSKIDKYNTKSMLYESMASEAFEKEYLATKEIAMRIAYRKAQDNFLKNPSKINEGRLKLIELGYIPNNYSAKNFSDNLYYRVVDDEQWKEK